MTREEILNYFKDINFMYNNSSMFDTLKRMLDELTEPCKDAVSREDACHLYCQLTCGKDYCTEPCGDLKMYWELPSVQPTSTPCEYAEDCKKMKFEPCEDAVSREAVLDYIRDNYRRWFINDDAFMQCVNGIKDFISVTPKQKVVRCKDCKHRDPETKKCDCGCWHFPFVTEDDDFCSYGETKMEGESE